MNSNNRCPRCDAGPLRSWRELNDEEREVVRRLPGSADRSAEERETTHLWCTRCWYEATDETTRTA